MALFIAFGLGCIAGLFVGASLGVAATMVVVVSAEMQEKRQKWQSK